jgi:hypothetical protein
MIAPVYTAALPLLLLLVPGSPLQKVAIKAAHAQHLQESKHENQVMNFRETAKTAGNLSEDNNNNEVVL